MCLFALGLLPLLGQDGSGSGCCPLSNLCKDIKTFMVTNTDKYIDNKIVDKGKGLNNSISLNPTGQSCSPANRRYEAVGTLSGSSSSWSPSSPASESPQA